MHDLWLSSQTWMYIHYNVKEGKVLTSFLKLKIKGFVCLLFPWRDSHKYKVLLKHLRKFLWMVYIIHNPLWILESCFGGKNIHLFNLFSKISLHWLGWTDPSLITCLWSNTYLYFHHMCFILSDLRCYGSATSSSRNHVWSAKEKD
jgi:hypothetical protein